MPMRRRRRWALPARSRRSSSVVCCALLAVDHAAFSCLCVLGGVRLSPRPPPPPLLPRLRSHACWRQGKWCWRWRPRLATPSSIQHLLFYSFSFIHRTAHRTPHLAPVPTSPHSCSSACTSSSWTPPSSNHPRVPRASGSGSAQLQCVCGGGWGPRYMRGRRRAEARQGSSGPSRRVAVTARRRLPLSFGVVSA